MVKVERTGGVTCAKVFAAIITVCRSLPSPILLLLLE